MSDNNWHGPHEPEREGTDEQGTTPPPGGDPLSGQQPPGSPQGGSWQHGGDQPSWRQPGEEQPWRSGSQEPWRQPDDSGWKQPEEQPWRQPGQLGGQPTWQQPGEQPASRPSWQQPTEPQQPVQQPVQPPAPQQPPGQQPPGQPPVQPPVQPPGQPPVQPGQPSEPEQPNPWQGAYPTAEQGGVHPASQSPYGSRPVEGVPPGWTFPPPMRPGQSPAGPPIQLPRGSFGTAPRGRRTRKGLIAVLVALALLVVGGGVAIALTGDDDKNVTTGPTTSPSPSPTPTPTPTQDPSTAPATPVQPKPKPKPKATVHQVVTANPLYKTGRVLASRCHEPAYRPTSFATVRAYYLRYLPCLNKAWAPSLQRAGYTFHAPKLVVYGGRIKSPCGFTSRPWYCGVNETIYLPWNVDVLNYRTNQEWARTWMAQTIAHEYGHHMQQLTGILPASWARQKAMPNVQGKLLESRRRELQASCFGGIYLGTDRTWFPMRGSFLVRWKWTISHTGDEYSKPKVRDHGAAAAHAYWTMKGFNGVRPIYCNTFAATPILTR